MDVLVFTDTDTTENQAEDIVWRNLRISFKALHMCTSGTLDLKEGKEEEEEWETKANLKILKNNKYNNS